MRAAQRRTSNSRYNSTTRLNGGEKSDLELAAARMSAVYSFRLGELLDNLRPNHQSSPVPSSQIVSAYGTAQRTNRRASSVTSDYQSLYGTRCSSHLQLNNNADGIYCDAQDFGFSRSQEYFWEDQTEAIQTHTNRGIEFLERFGQFTKERAKIEEEYASSLRKLCKKYTPKKDDPEAQFSYVHSFTAMLNELGCVSNQHDIVVEAFKTTIQQRVHSKVKEFRESRKTHLYEIDHLEAQMRHTKEQMEKALKDYSKAWKEAQGAYQKHMRADQNMDISRAELEKAKNNGIFKGQQSEDAKNTYAQAMQRANATQHEHYSKLLPCALEKLRAVDEARIRELSTLIDSCVEIELSTVPIVKKCLEEMKQRALEVNAAHDSELVVSKYRTGYTIPMEFEFRDYGDPSKVVGDPPMNGNGQTDERTIVPNDGRRRSDRAGTLGRKSTGKSFGHKLFGGHKNVEVQEDYSDLPPQQRCQKLTKKLSSIDKTIAMKVQSREGVLKMQAVYRQNPKMGDPNIVENELKELSSDMEKLQVEKSKFEGYLAEAQQLVQTPRGGMSAGQSPSSARTSRPPHHDRSSIHSSDHESMSSEGSNHPRMVQQQQQQQMHQQQANQQRRVAANGSPESGIGGGSSQVSVTSSKPNIAASQQEELYNEPEMPVLGTAKVLFTYEAGSEGTIEIKEGEEVLLVEKDEGDGWTRLRRMKGDEEGFAPTSYLECKWYPS